MEGPKGKPRWAAAYLWLQAVAVAGWWIWLALRPDARGLFFPPMAGRLVFGFAVPDFSVLVMGSLIGGFGLARGRRRMAPLLAVLFGGCLYAALYTVAIVAMDPAAWLGCAAMALMTTGTGLVAFGREGR
ncbi:MAG TPA: hypothetical protein VMI31_04410 [Fimbriimonadaceae bacterium]|nr:hypothetical protein [Fimbriimonadaceae bacterium]